MYEAPDTLKNEFYIPVLEIEHRHIYYFRKKVKEFKFCVVGFPTKDSEILRNIRPVEYRPYLARIQTTLWQCKMMRFHKNTKQLNFILSIFTTTLNNQHSHSTMSLKCFYSFVFKPTNFVQNNILKPMK